MATMFVLILAAFAMVQAQDYCTVCSDNTMCLYNTTNPGSACSNFTSSTLNSTMQAAIVDKFNTLRNQVALGQVSGQPSASNMRKMEWDDEVATIAQRWANQCTFEHDTCRSTSDGSYNGQCVALITSTQTDPITPVMTDAVQYWYDEVSSRNGTLNTLPFTSENVTVTGHYTQLVWADSYKVGCGYSDYDANNVRNQLIVCNFKPGGNVIGETTYASGTAASNCPNGTSADSTYPGLCA